MIGKANSKIEFGRVFENCPFTKIAQNRLIDVKSTLLHPLKNGNAIYLAYLFLPLERFLILLS